MTEKPRFKRKYTDEDLDTFKPMFYANVDPWKDELKRTYKLLAEAERMAARIEEICDEPQKPWVGFIIPSEIGNEVTNFLERLSK